jgi:hypothetical protein
LVVAVAAAIAPVVLFAADRSSKKHAAPANAESVEMFAAIEKGQIDVQLIPKDSTQCRVMIQNKTTKPLSVKLPETFAGVPVLAQGLAGGAAGGGGGGGGGQAMGGGMGMGGMGMGGGGGGGGFFNVAPEKVGQLKVTTVCLEHGKPEPRPAMKYQLKPLEQVTDKKEVSELCRMLGQGVVPQRAAQVAAWHLNNGMTFEQLATKQLHYADGSTAPYFTPQELQVGMQAVAAATKAVQEKQQTEKTDSLSQK